METKKCTGCDKEFSKKPEERNCDFLSKKYCCVECYRNNKNQKVNLDLLGMRFGRLVATQRLDNKKMWLCRCDCGLTTRVKYHHLLAGETKSCGCGFKNKDSLIGQRFTRLTVVSFSDRGDDTDYKCVCDCGKIVFVQRCGLKTGNNKSCGCYRNEMTKKRVGDRHPSWRSDISQEERVKRRQEDIPKYDFWRKSVFVRDNFRCKICNCSGGINAHHLDGWNWCKGRRYDINNGVTLCTKHHKEFHSLFGNKDNTSEEFFQYYVVMKASNVKS